MKFVVWFLIVAIATALAQVPPVCMQLAGTNAAVNCCDATRSHCKTQFSTSENHGIARECPACLPSAVSGQLAILAVSELFAGAPASTVTWQVTSPEKGQQRNEPPSLPPPRWHAA